MIEGGNLLEKNLQLNLAANDISSNICHVGRKTLIARINFSQPYIKSMSVNTSVCLLRTNCDESTRSQQLRERKAYAIYVLLYWHNDIMT